jgi:resuscitation-promoting factor RpfA
VANGSGRSIAPVRKVVAGVLGAFAVFVILFGAGMTSWAIVVLGLAMLVLAIALVVVTAVRGGARAWVAGSAHVVSASEPPANSTYGRCELQIVVEAPGMPAAAVKIRDPRVSVAKWPDAGTTLPIMVAVDDPRHVRIQWDDVPTHAEAAAAEEETRGGYYDIAVGPYDDEDDLPGVGPLPPLDEDDVISGVDDVPPAGSPDLRRPTAERRDEAAGGRGDEPVVVTDTPSGPVVEGRVVDAPVSPGGADVPRPRPRPRPRHPRGSRPRGEGGAKSANSANSGKTAGGTAGGSAKPAPAVRSDTPFRPEARPEAAAEEADVDGSVRTAVATAAAETPSPLTPNGVDVLADDVVLAQLITAYPSARPGPTGSIHGVGITMQVTDLDRSVAFYRDMLGFYEIDGGDGSAVLASGDTRLVLRMVRDAERVVRRVVHLNLEVGDVEGVYRELKAKGVRFTHGPRSVNKGEKLEQWAATFQDPDGHGIALTQWRGRPAA